MFHIIHSPIASWDTPNDCAWSQTIQHVFKLSKTFSNYPGHLPRIQSGLQQSWAVSNDSGQSPTFLASHKYCGHHYISQKTAISLFPISGIMSRRMVIHYKIKMSKRPHEINGNMKDSK